MIIDWFKHLPTRDEQEAFKKTVMAHSIVLNRLRDIIAEYEAELLAMERSMDAYESPSWACRQAHLNGRLQELNRLKQLLTLEENTK